MTSRPRIYADFNGITPSPRDPSRLMVPLDTWGSLRDLSNAGIKLTEGAALLIYSDSDEAEDLEADTRVYFDPVRNWWFAELEHGYRYVPTHVSSVVTFLCLGCRADLGPEALEHGSAIIKRYRECPHCGLSILAAIAPP
jgi:hypothetical protein